jgi:hypothetical protein
MKVCGFFVFANLKLVYLWGFWAIFVPKASAMLVFVSTRRMGGAFFSDTHQAFQHR